MDKPIVRCSLCERLVRATYAEHLRVCGARRPRAVSNAPVGGDLARRTCVGAQNAKRQHAVKVAKTVNPHTLHFT